MSDGPAGWLGRFIFEAGKLGQVRVGHVVDGGLIGEAESLAQAAQTVTLRLARRADDARPSGRTRGGGLR